MNVDARLAELAQLRGATTPVVSVYLNTRWADEHQRDRVRVFLKTEIRRAREAGAGSGIDDDLDWIQLQGESLIAQTRSPDAHGVALFACRSLGLQEVLPVRVPFEDAFVVAQSPFLRPLAGLVEELPSMLVVFVDGESARLIPLTPQGAGEEVTLLGDVPGRHRRGGWAQLAESRYRRHIEDHRGRHFEAVVQALIHLAEANGTRRIVLAGEPGTVAAFRKHLPERLGTRLAGPVPASRHEPGAAIAARATELVLRLVAQEAHAAVDAVLTEAAKGGQAVASLDETLEAVARGAVLRAYLLRSFRDLGRACAACGRLQPGDGTLCRQCGSPTTEVELGEAVVSRVVAAGGSVETVAEHEGLARVGGLAARLRYPL